MTIRNWRVVVLSAVVSTLLAACGGAEDSATPEQPSNGPPPPPPQVPTNVLPIITGAPTTGIVAGTTYIFQPAATDTDGNPLTFVAIGMPAWLSINPQTGTVFGTPSEADVGTTGDIFVSVSDGTATVTLPAFRITVTSSVPPPVTPPPPPPPPPVTPPVNAAPVISGSPLTTVQAATAYSFTPVASDPESQPLTFAIANKPSWATFNSSTGRLSGTPTAGQVGTYINITISVSDGTLGAVLPPFSIAVTSAPNRAPTVSGSFPASVTVGSAYSFTPAGSDPDGQPLTWSIGNKPSWATFNTSTGRLSGTPTSANVGTSLNIIISASDGSLSASLAPFSITVNAPANTAPTISGTPATSVVAGSAYSFTPTSGDADGNTLGFSISGKPSWATFSVATGALTGTPTTAQAGSYANIVISVSDGTVSRSMAAFTITVTQPVPSGTAALSWSAPTQNTDGSAVTDLAGYRIYHGMSAGSLNQYFQLAGASNTSYTATQLGSGTHYFAVAAYNSAGVESALSAIGSKTIP